LFGTFLPIFAVSGSEPLWAASHATLFLCAFPLTVVTAWLSFGFVGQRFDRMGGAEHSGPHTRAC
jgi:hypothetical protein